MSLPFIVGVAGHRQVSRETAVVQEVETFLKEISQQAPVSMQARQLFVVSSLAEGADRLVAHTALQLGWRLIVVLPFPQARFEQDFPHSVNEFRSLLQQAEMIVIADENLVSNRDLGLESGAPQDAGYERAAVYVAQHVNVLLALWDGIPYDGGRGGTAHSVLMRRTSQASMGSMRLAEECLGQVYHIHVPRQQEARLPPQWLDSGPGVRPFPTAVKYFLTQIESFNASAAKFREQPSVKWQEAAEQLQLSASSELRLVTTFADASLNSNDFQSNFRLRLIGSIAVLVVGGFGKEILNMVHLTQSGVVVYLISLLVAAILLGNTPFKRRDARRLSARDQHVEMRVLAEILRIGAALRMTGSPLAPTRLVPNYLWEPRAWIPDAVEALWLTLPPPAPATAYARQTWMPSQVYKFLDLRLATVNNIKKYLQIVLKVAFFLAVSAACLMLIVTVVVPVGSKQSNALSLLTTANTILLLLISATGFYAQKNGLDEDESRYRGLKRLYEQGMTRWDGLPPLRHAALVEELAREAGTELLTWMHTTRLKPLELWR